MMNVHKLPYRKLRMGLDNNSDTFSFVHRIAIFNDAEEKNKYLSDTPFAIYRVTPKKDRTESAIPFLSLPRAPRGSRYTEDYLRDTLNDLELNINDAHPGIGHFNLAVRSVNVFGNDCLEKIIPCARDNGDAAYFLHLPSPSSHLTDEHYYIVFGINHMKTGHARYISVALYDAETQVGFDAFDSINDMDGSADQYLPNHPDKDKLFAFTVRRNCNQEKYCIEVGYEPFVGVRENLPPAFLFLVYLEPGSNTGPLQNELLPMSVKYVKPNSIEDYIVSNLNGL
mmetsp:Transcript_54436/g.63629  ORF Transcript_54436/g.63629 Transcript_54436/m.63629 type:complete len:283 (-) Transcript_54436:514-1362(-)